MTLENIPNVTCDTVEYQFYIYNKRAGEIPPAGLQSAEVREVRVKRYAVIFLAITGVLVWCLASSVRGEVPGLINYQGKLTDELGVPVNREAEMTFAIYTEAAGGGPVWSESQDVQVTDGIFNVLLGSINPLMPDHFAAGPETYLGVKISEDAELTPRQKIASTAYSLRSEISDGLSLDAQTTLLEVVYPVG